MTSGLLAARSPRRFSRALIVSVLSGVLLTGPIAVALPTKANAAAADPTQTCATLGLAGDDLSGSSEGDHTVYVGDPATVVATNTNILPEEVILTPDGESPQTATLGPYSSHTFRLPSPGSLQTPYKHSFGIKVDGIPYEESTSAQMLGFVKSDLCQSQRILTAAQVAGTGVAPVSGTGSLSFKIHLSAEAPPISTYNPHQFIIGYYQQAENGNADLANGIDGNVTVPPGAQDAVVTVPVTARPAGSPADSIQFLLTDNDNHVPSPVLFTGTITSAPRSLLYPGERLNPGDQLTSLNGRYLLVMQGDGNLVEYDAGRSVWTSNTAGHSGSDFEAQSDGNFVVYAPGHVSVWESNTAGRAGSAGSVLKIQDDRNIVIYAPGNVAVWESHTAA